MRPPSPVGMVWTGVWISVLAFGVPPASAQAIAQPCVAPDARIRLDHVPIAVADLEALSHRLADEFGFSVNPGRLHENGLLTRHIRFSDGSELELMTVREPQDELADRYAQLIADGGGGAYLALSGLPVDSIDAALVLREPELTVTRTPAFDWASFPRGHALHPVFFVDTHRRSPELREQVEHANGATGLDAVWVSVEDPDRLVALLTLLGGRACGMVRHPEHLFGRAVGVRGGTVVVVDARTWEADPDSAPVVSITLAGSAPGAYRSVVLGEAGGLWLEVRGARRP